MSGAARRDANSRSRYAALNINPPNQRGQNDSRTGSRRGNMQSLGKISGRRMPAPAQLKSLKSENEGNDPTVNLVPQGGGGWRNSHKEEEEEVEPKKEEEPRRQRWNNPPPQPQPRAGPENFRSDFPSLKEHEKMTKKERDELHQRQLEEAERSEQRMERSHSPYQDFPKHPDGGPWRGQGYPPPHPPSRRGGGQGPMRGNNSYYRMGTHPDQPPYPSHHQPQHGGYPPMAYRQQPPSYYNKNPYEISPNPYKMPPGERKWDTGESRPPTVRSDDIDNMDEEGDVGWAGHYEEVDYSKEVVFEDSSDEESPKEEKKGRTHSGRQRGDKVNQSPKAALHKPKEKPREQSQPRCWKQIPSQPAIDLSKNELADPQEEMNAHSSLHSPPPHGYPPGDQFYHYNRPSPHQSRHGDHWVSHPYAYPPSSRGPMKHRRGSWEHEERDRGRSNFHPHWDAMEADGQNRHRSSFDKPKILMTKHAKEGERDNTVVTPTSPSERLPVGKEEKDSSHVEPTASSQSRMPPKKIMIRNLSERSNEDGSDHSSPKEVKDVSHTPTGGDKVDKPFKPAASSTSVSSPVPTEGSEGDSTRAKVAWDSKDRGPIMSQKTLYEPEGKKSEAKFHNYQRMATETIAGVGGGKLLRVSSSGSAKGEQTSESPKNTSAGILGEAPMAVELLEKVQFHGRVQRRPHGDHPSPLSPCVQQQQPIGRRDTDSGRPPRRGEHDRGEYSKGRRRDSRESAPEERKVSQRKQKSQSREEQSEGGGRGRRRGDVDTRQRHREVEKRDGQREVSGSQDSSKKQELPVNKVGREKPHESNERGEGRRSRPGSQSYQERERGTNSERHDQQRAHDGERSRDRHRDRRRAPDSDWSKDKNWDHRSREIDLPRERKDDSSAGQANDKPRERNRDRDQRTRDRHTDSSKDHDSAKDRDSRRGRPSQDQKRLQEDSHQQSQSTDKPQSSVSLGNVSDGNRRKHKSELATAKPSAEYKDLPNRVVQELSTEDADKKVERAPVSRDQDRDRDRDRRRDRQRPRDRGRGEERRRGQTHGSQHEHQVSVRNLPRQGQKREANDHGTRRKTRDRRDETGEAGDDSSRQQPSGIREPAERSGRGRGSGRGGSRLETHFPKDSAKVYEQLEDIESASDWENDESMCLSEETGEAKKGEFSSSEHTRRPHREERQRPGSGGDKRSRIGRGRGRGQPPSERQEYPSSNRRRDQRFDSKVDTYSRSQGASSSIHFGDIDDIEAKPNRRNTVSSQETRRADDIPHKGQDISRFDVNSQGVVVVDEEGYDEEVLPQSPLVSGESDGFQVVRTKREKQKDKEEKKKMEEKERRKDRDHHYRSHSLLPSGSVSSNLPLNKLTAEQSGTWGVLPDLSEPSKAVWTEWSGNELPLSFPSNFGAVGEKFQKDPFHKPSSTPQPGSTLSDKDQSYQLFSPQTYPLGPTVAPRTGDMLMAAVDQSVRIPFSASQVPKEKPASLSEILENEGVSDEKNVEERVRDSGRTQKQTGSHSGQQKGNVKRKTTDDRFYIPPHTRQDTSRGSRRQHPSSSIRSNKSSSATKSQTKVTGLADAHLEGTGACDDHVTEPGRLQQFQRAGGAETHLLEVCQDTTEQCSNGHCKVTQQVPHIDRPRKGSNPRVELTTQKQAVETRSQCNVERISGGVELDSKSKSYASALMSVPLHQKGVGLSSVAASSGSCSSTTSTHGSNSPVPLDSSGPGEDGLHVEGDEDEFVEEKDALATQPEENEDIGCAPGHEDREIDGKEGRNESLSHEIMLPPSPSESQCQSSTLPISLPTGLSNLSPTDSSKGVHQAMPLVPKLSSLSSPRIGTDDQNYTDSTLLRSTSALGIAPDSLVSHFSSSSPPNSLPDVTSPFIKVRLSSALTRTSSAPCPLPQAAPGPVDRRAHSPVSPLSKMATAISSVDQPDSEPGKVLQREEEMEGEPDDRSDSSISKCSSLSIMADEFVPKYGMAATPAANVNQYTAPRVQPSPITTVGSAQHQSWPKSNFSHPPPPPPQHQQQSLLNQPSFPTHIQLHVLAAAQLQLQQQLAAASANDQRVSNIPTQRVFHQPLQIPVPMPQLSHPVSPQQPPPPVLHPTLPMAIHHCPPLQVQNMAIRHPAMTMASKPNFPPSMLQYGDKEREKAGPLGSVLIQQQLQQQHHRQQKSLKAVAQPSAPIHQRHPQQLALLPTAPPHQHPIQLPLQAQSQLNSSLVLGRHSLTQLGIPQNLALFPQAAVNNPVDVIRRQPSSRPPLLPTPPDFTLITAARTTTTPGVHPPVVNSTISPPITWPPQVRISATHDSSLGPLPLNPPISLPN